MTVYKQVQYHCSSCVHTCSLNVFIRHDEIHLTGDPQTAIVLLNNSGSVHFGWIDFIEGRVSRKAISCFRKAIDFF